MSKTALPSYALALLIALPLAPFARAGLDKQAWLTTKTPYAPQQDAASYEPAPAGFAPVFTELVARHGSRGLSSPSSDLVLYNMWLQAQAEGALTPLGTRLGAEVMQVTRANALLGYGVPGITAPGYGNLTQIGIAEHTQLAVRLKARLRDYFAQVAATASTAPRQIVIATSGVNRAVDSSNYFRQSLAQQAPGLTPLIVSAPPLTAYPVGKPVAQAAGVNRFELYSHKLNSKTDLPDASDPYYPTYQASLAYQSYSASDATLSAKVNGLLAEPRSKAAARAALSRIFTPAFLDKIDNGSATFTNTGSYTFTSDDGLYTTTIVGDGETTVASLLDAANALYGVYVITPSMANEVPVNLRKYLPSPALETLASLSDMEDFYQKGPGIAEAGRVNDAQTQALLDDFFAEIDAVVTAMAKGDAAHAAKLRFTHAEIIIPFASRLGLAGVYAPVPQAQNYRYASNPWRGEAVSPLAANVQWDVLRNSAGTLLVKMLYNERETDFKPACESARYLAGSTSHYYEYSKLKACYAN